MPLAVASALMFFAISCAVPVWEPYSTVSIGSGAAGALGTTCWALQDDHHHQHHSGVSNAFAPELEGRRSIMMACLRCCTSTCGATAMARPSTTSILSTLILKVSCMHRKLHHLA